MNTFVARLWPATAGIAALLLVTFWTFGVRAFKVSDEYV